MMMMMMMMIIHMETINVNCKSHTAYITILGGPNEQCLAFCVIQILVLLNYCLFCVVLWTVCV